MMAGNHIITGLCSKINPETTANNRKNYFSMKGNIFIQNHESIYIIEEYYIDSYYRNTTRSDVYRFIFKNH